jgi:hypothetical protein
MEESIKFTLQQEADKISISPRRCKLEGRGTQLPQDRLTTLLCTDEQVLLAENENELQRSLCSLKMTVLNYNLEISTKNTKVVALHGKWPVRPQIVMNDQCRGWKRSPSHC